ncbi:Retrovirus-related Pol polyprotein from transposon TNT 1-94-like protein [Drosera capensis]
MEDITDKDLAGSNGSSGDRTGEKTVLVTPEVRRSSITIRPPQRYSPSANYLLLTEDEEPQYCDEALQMDDSAQWALAMQEEMNSLEKNHTWFLTTLPAGKKALRNNQEDLHLEQLDVKTTFLHGVLDEDIYMVQPEGYQIVGKENLVSKLTKGLHGLKQVARQWYLKFNNFMSRSGYKKSDMDPCCYTRHFCSSYIILLLYVDDMLVAGSDMEEINRLKEQLFEEFEMKDFGASKQILGMSISSNRSEGSLILSQEKYIGKMLERFSMQDAKATCTPLGAHFNHTKKQSPKTNKDNTEMARVPYASIVGSLMYAMVCTRPEIAQAVGVISRFMSNPGRQHWEEVKWLLRYLKGTSKTSLRFNKNNVVLEGYSDADLGGCSDTRKSTTGFVFIVGGTTV